MQIDELCLPCIRFCLGSSCVLCLCTFLCCRLDIPKEQLIKDYTSEKPVARELELNEAAAGTGAKDQGQSAATPNDDTISETGGLDMDVIREKLPHWIAGAADVDMDNTEEEEGDEKTGGGLSEKENQDPENAVARETTPSLPPGSLLGSTKIRAPSTSSPRRIVPSVRRSRSARVRVHQTAEGAGSTGTSSARLRRNVSLSGADRARVQPIVPSRSLSDALISPSPTVTATTPALASPALSSGEITPTVQPCDSKENLSVLTPAAPGDSPCKVSLPSTDSTPLVPRATPNQRLSAVGTSVVSLSSSGSESSSDSSSDESTDLSKTLRAEGNTAADTVKPLVPAAASVPSVGAKTAINRTSSSPALAKSERLSNNKRVRSSENGRVYRLLCYFEALAEEKRVHEEREKEARMKQVVSPPSLRRASQVSHGVGGAASYSGAVARRVSSGDVTSRWSSINSAARAQESSSAPGSVLHSRSTSFSTHIREEPHNPVSPVASSGSVVTTDSGCSACNSGASIDSGNVDSGCTSPPAVHVNEKDAEEIGLSFISLPEAHQRHASESGLELSAGSSSVDMSRTAADRQQSLSPLEAAHAELSGHIRCHSRTSHCGAAVDASNAATNVIDDGETDV